MRLRSLSEKKTCHVNMSRFYMSKMALCFSGWLMRNSLNALSACEVILCDGRFAELRGEVARADVFWSHVQKESFLGDRLSVENVLHREDPRTGAARLLW